MSVYTDAGDLDPIGNHTEVRKWIAALPFADQTCFFRNNKARFIAKWFKQTCTFMSEYNSNDGE